jgi:hypothetical protein
MQPDLTMAEAALAYVMETAPVLALQLDAGQRVVVANAHALCVLGDGVVGRTLRELVVDFTDLPDHPGDELHLLTLNTAAGMPESFYFRRFALAAGSLALGILDFSQQERLRTEVLGLNRDLNDLTRKLHLANAELREKNQALEAALANVKQLRGLLPICSGCKKIRDDKNYWHQVDDYIQKHSEAKFTHGMCPDCLKIYFPGLSGDAPGKGPPKAP